MPATVSIILSSSNVVVGQKMNAVVAVRDLDGSGPYTLRSCAVVESTESNAVVEQPMCAMPNQPVGVGQMVTPLNGTTYLPFSFVVQTPYASGPSPQAPGGAAPANIAATAEPVFQFTATVQYTVSSGAIQVVSGTLLVPALSTIPPFPLAQGGALQLSQGANLLNLLYL
jgi:hypothetical protein